MPAIFPANNWLGTHRAQHHLHDAVGLLLNDAAHDVHAVDEHEREHEDAEHEAEQGAFLALLFPGLDVERHQGHVGLERQVGVVVQIRPLPHLQALQRFAEVAFHGALGPARRRRQLQQLHFLALHQPGVERHHAGVSLGLQHLLGFLFPAKPVGQQRPLPVTRRTRRHELISVRRDGDQAVVVDHPHLHRVFRGLREQHQTGNQPHGEDGTQDGRNHKGPAPNAGEVFPSDNRQDGAQPIHAPTDSTVWTKTSSMESRTGRASKTSTCCTAHAKKAGMPHDSGKVRSNV